MPVDITLKDFKARVGLGTRSNRFVLTGNIPGSSKAVTAEATALNLPSADITPIPVPFRGRILKVPGDRKYPSWSVIMYDTTKNDFGGKRLWNRFHEWSNTINNHITNVTEWGAEDSKYVQDWTVEHYDLNGQTKLKTIVLKNCWPSSVGEMQLASGEMDTLATFGCILEYEYFTYL